MTAPKKKTAVQRESPSAERAQPKESIPLIRRDTLNTFQTEKPHRLQRASPLRQPSIPFTLRKQEDASTTPPAASCGPI